METCFFIPIAYAERDRSPNKGDQGQIESCDKDRDLPKRTLAVSYCVDSLISQKMLYGPWICSTVTYSPLMSLESKQCSLYLVLPCNSATWSKASRSASLRCHDLKGHAVEIPYSRHRLDGHDESRLTDLREASVHFEPFWVRMEWLTLISLNVIS